MERPFFDVKDADGNVMGTAQFPEDVAKVIGEVKTLGDNTKQVMDEIGKEHKALKDAIDGLGDKTLTKADSLVKEKVDKLAETLATRTDELDKAYTKRMNEIEVAMQRRGQGSEGDEHEELKEAKEFKSNLLARSGKTIKPHQISDADADLEGYQEYKEAFNSYLNSPGNW